MRTHWQAHILAAKQLPNNRHWHLQLSPSRLLCTKTTRRTVCLLSRPTWLVSHPMLILITTSTSHQISRSFGMLLAFKLLLLTAVPALLLPPTSSPFTRTPQSQWALSPIRSLAVTSARDPSTLTRFVLETSANSCGSTLQQSYHRMRGSTTNKVLTESSVMGPVQRTGTSSSTQKAKQLIRSSWPPLQTFCWTRQQVPNQT